MRQDRADPPSGRLDGRADSELVLRAAAGDAAAFEELYRRHAPAAWRVAQAVAGNREDAADAVSDAFTRVFQVLPAGRLAEGEQFGPYLLAATRNAAIDGLRRGGRLEPTDRLESLDRPAVAPGPFDLLMEGEDSSLVAQAFRSLPERWRSVLWMTEVEGLPPRVVAARMGLTANTAAQLATRARAGLRERYLQAHLNARVDKECRFCVEHLGAYVAGRLAPRDLAKVDQHLAGCNSCRERHEEVEAVGSTLRRIALPLPALLAPKALATWRKATATAVPVDASAFGAGDSLQAALAKLHKPLLALSSGIFALGLISASVVGSPRAPLQGTRRALVPVPRAAAPVLVEDAVATSAPVIDAPAEAVEAVSPPAEPAPGVPSKPRVAPQKDGLAAVPPGLVQEPVANAGIALAVGPVELGLSVGLGDAPVDVEEAACVGSNVGELVPAGCEPPPPPDGAIAVTVVPGGESLGPLDGQAVSVATPL